MTKMAKLHGGVSQWIVGQWLMSFLDYLCDITSMMLVTSLNNTTVDLLFSEQDFNINTNRKFHPKTHILLCYLAIVTLIC